MEHSPHQSIQMSQGIKPPARKEIILNPEIALAFQMMLMKSYFRRSKDGREMSYDNDAEIRDWVSKYSDAFRVFCEDKDNQGIVTKINNGTAKFGGQDGDISYINVSLTEKEIQIVVNYLIATRKKAEGTVTLH